MENIISYLMQNTEALTMAIVAIVTIIYIIILKKAPSIKSSALIKGLSEKTVEILLLIFNHTEYNYKEYNKTLKNPVKLDATKPLGQQRMDVAVQAIKEQLPNSKINKYGSWLNFAQFAYNILKPLFKKGN